MIRPRDPNRLVALLLATALALSVRAPSPVGAQDAGRPLVGSLAAEVTAGGELARYLRLLQLAGEAPPTPWTLRTFSPRAVDRRSPTSRNHPWAAILPTSGPVEEIRVDWMRGEVRSVFNSTFPEGANDGGLWAGKGMNGSVRTGVLVRAPWADVRVAPELFWSQNLSFDLVPNGGRGEARLRDFLSRGTIDRPQRFGDGSLLRLDPGASAIHLYAPGMVAGLSSAPEVWGGAQAYPLLLGTNAGGFPRLFLGTDGPLELWLFRLQGRLLMGRLEQSDYSPVQSGETRRLTTAFAFSLTPRGLPGLELGVTRFLHSTWPAEGPRIGDLFRSFGGLIQEPGSPQQGGGENSVGGVFFRWAFPRAGLEVFAEMIREDFALDTRQLIEDPDDYSGYSMGLQKVFRLASGNLLAVRAEVTEAHYPWVEVDDRDRFTLFPLGPVSPRPLYRHSGVRQGHTHRGQLLGSPAAYGGSGTTVAVDWYRPRGRWGIKLERTHRADWNRITGNGEPDVIYALSFEAVRFMDQVELFARVKPSLNLNRNVQAGNDLFNLGLSLGVRYLPGSLIDPEGRPGADGSGGEEGGS